MERVTGIGGVFLRAGDAAALRAWYAEHLGIDLGEWGSTSFDWTAGGATAFAVFERETPYLGRPEQSFMVNFRVADLDAMLAQLRAARVEVDAEVQESEHGRFGWAFDPEGTRFDRYDVNAPSSQQASLGRPLNTQYGASIVQTFAYKAIAWHSSNLASFNLVDEDANNLTAWRVRP